MHWVARDVRVIWLLTAPVLETMDGCRESIRCMSLGDLFRLCKAFNCSVDSMARSMYRAARLLRRILDGRKFHKWIGQKDLAGEAIRARA